MISLSGRMKTILVALCLLTVASAKAQDILVDNLSLHRAETLRPLEEKGFSIASMLAANPNLKRLSNQELLENPNYEIVYKSIEKEIAKFKEANTGLSRFFSLKFLNSASARFVLVGIVNRMDRGYVTQDRCGETRFIYRLAYNVTNNGQSSFSRLPMTINIVFRGSTDKQNSTCAELAKSWLKLSPQSTQEEILAAGPIQKNFFNYKNFDRLEINMQITRSGAGATGDFGGHAEYLLKVYKMDEKFQLAETYLENQIDRKRLSEDADLLEELKKWLKQSSTLKALDQGTLLIPTKFLAKTAYSLAPGGIARSKNRPFYGLVKQADFENTVLKDYENIKSTAGVIRRLNDSTCVGCHQTRAIGGFHFTGRDPFGKYPGNSVFLPGSPHFLGDLPRRLDLVKSVAQNKSEIDYSRGFSARPQSKYKDLLNGSGLYNGWGSHCTTENDPSFAGWKCDAGLECKQLHDISDKTGMGICIGGEKQQVGDPCEFGTVTNSGYGKDKFNRFPVKYHVLLSNSQCSPQSQLPGTSTGGFLHGSIKKKTCEDGPGEAGLPPEAQCGPTPKPGFNECIGTRNFDQCLTKFTATAGLRGCDQKNPCRDDYICAESFSDKRGICMPPYFLFQFRIDGHATSSF